MKRLLLAFAVLLVCSVASAQQSFTIQGPGNQFRQGAITPWGGYSFGTGGWQQWSVTPDYSAPYRSYYGPVYQPYYAPVYRPYYSPGFYQSPYMAGYRLPGYGF